jgi:hypothetical protein
MPGFFRRVVDTPTALLSRAKEMLDGVRVRRAACGVRRAVRRGATSRDREIFGYSRATLAQAFVRRLL